MSKLKSWDQEEILIYATFWRFIELAVHRYGSAPTGQTLVVLTIWLLDRLDYHPTVGELAEITRLPKSTVSRYVSTEMGVGHVEERIDPEDRRRRLLFPTETARSEQGWHSDRMREISKSVAQAFEDSETPQQQAKILMKMIRDVSSQEGSNR